MSSRSFKKLWDQTRTLFWVIWGVFVVGALIGCTQAVLLATFMILSMSGMLLLAKVVDGKVEKKMNGNNVVGRDEK